MTNRKVSWLNTVQVNIRGKTMLEDLPKNNEDIPERHGQKTDQNYNVILTQ